VDATFPDINFQITPVEGFGVGRFVAEAKNRESIWDVYAGQTPFLEMTALARVGVIEPWDNDIPKALIDDILPAIREEGAIDGRLYNWPFLLDVSGSGWHSGWTTKVDPPDAAPACWDDFLCEARRIVDSQAAP
jgi:multiple sugar transport system substrate-binding protein